MSADYVEVHEGVRHPIGIEGARAHVTGVRATYPDLRLTVERQIAEGEWVATVVTMRGPTSANGRASGRRESPCR